MNLVFTGFMGTGKSKTGKIISEKLNRGFFDTDALIEEKFGLSVGDIFKKFGEVWFRRAETNIIKEVSRKDSVVISCGGGVVLNSENIVFLRQKGIIINLYASAEVIYERLRNEDNRPLLKCSAPMTEIKKLLNLRRSYYVDCDFAFNTENLTPAEVADKILNSEGVKTLLF